MQSMMPLQGVRLHAWLQKVPSSFDLRNWPGLDATLGHVPTSNRRGSSKDFRGGISSRIDNCKIAEPEHARSDEEMEESSTDWQYREVRVAAVESFGRLSLPEPRGCYP